MCKIPMRLRIGSPQLKRTELFQIRSELSLPASFRYEPCNLDCFDSLDAALFMFGGSCYFVDRDEQDAVCRLLGLLQRPSTPAQQRAFDASWTDNLFINPQNRVVVCPQI